MIIMWLYPIDRAGKTKDLVKNLIMMQQLLQTFADGRFHSGEAIASACGLTRAAVWKQINKLRAMGLSVDSVRGKGYRMRRGLDLLDPDKIISLLDGDGLSLLEALEVHSVLDSTSLYLKKMLQYPQQRKSRTAERYFTAEAKPAYACLAEYQTAGRGRRGRDWHAAYASSLCFSVLWRFDFSPAAMNGLSLALGVALVDALHQYGVTTAGLKWPNDIYCNNKKLGGILFEVFAEQGGDGYVLAGVGINLEMSPHTAQSIDQPWTDLSRAAPGLKVDRNALAAMLLRQSCLAMQKFSQSGFEAFAGQWAEYDICANHAVNLQLGKQQLHGIARGVDEQGQLLLDTEQGRKVYASGEVSLRLAE